MHMLTNAAWFDLHLEPKFIVKECVTYVRSVLIYGSELLNEEAQKPFIALDEKLTNLLMAKILKLWSR